MKLITCMMDLVLSRHIQEAKKANRPLTNPTMDQNILDAMFDILVGVDQFTGNAVISIMPCVY
jgi:hypothetical protein